MRSSSKYQQIRKEASRNAPGRGNAQATGVVRHFAGKRGAAAVSDSDDSDDDQDEEEDEEEEQEETPNDTTSTYAGQEAGENGQVEEEKEPALKPKMMIKPITVKITDRPPEPPVVKVKPVQAPEKPMQRSSIKAAPPPESSSEEEDDSEEEDSSSESDAPVLVKPTFISKAKRAQAATNKPVVAASTKPAATNTDDDAAAAAKRKEQTLALAEHSLQHQADLEALLQQTTALDAELAKVDDTDDTDPAAERAAWRLRELARLQRDRNVRPKPLPAAANGSKTSRTRNGKPGRTNPAATTCSGTTIRVPFSKRMSSSRTGISVAPWRMTTTTSAFCPRLCRRAQAARSGCVDGLNTGR